MVLATAVDGKRHSELRTGPHIFQRTPDTVEDIEKQLPKEWVIIARRSYRNWAELWVINRVGLGIKQGTNTMAFTKTDRVTALVVLKCPATDEYIVITEGKTKSCTQLKKDTVYFFIIKFWAGRRKELYLSREYLIELRTGSPPAKRKELRVTTQKLTSTDSPRRTTSKSSTVLKRSKMRFIPWGKEPAQVVQRSVIVAEPLLENLEDLEHQTMQLLKIKPQPSVRKEWEIEALIGIIGASMLSLAALGTVSCFILWHHLNKKSNEVVIVQFLLRRMERDVIR